MKKLSLLIAGLILTGLPANTLAVVTEIPVIEWIRQLGTDRPDRAYAVSVDSGGNAYVTGFTEYGLDGNTSAGGVDVFLTKYDTDGNKQWTEQLGTGGDDYGGTVSVDSSSNAYVTGTTYGGLDGNTNAGENDMFLTKYDTDGEKQWTEQLGTSSNDFGRGGSVDSGGNGYVTGLTYGGLDGNTNAGNTDMFLTKYDTDGNKQWTEQLGTSSEDKGNGVSLDGSGNAYVTGTTSGGLDGNTSAGGEDMFLTKYDTAGNKQWTRQLGTSSNDYGHGVSVDSGGNAYVTGVTYGGLDGNTNAGGRDVFLTKYDTDGNKQWTEQLGTSSTDWSEDVSVDSGGNAYVTGVTYGGLDGNTNAGDGDMFLTKYDTDGTKLWTCQLGTVNHEVAKGVSLDSSGNAYVAGYTYGGLDGNTNAGYHDIFLIKVSTIPEYIAFSLDIKPESDENPLNLKSKGVLPVSILTTDEFDALTVDIETLVFGDPLLIDDGSTPVPPIRFDEVDVNRDGLLDLTLFFSVPELVENGLLGLLSEEASLTGALLDGTEIIGSDILRIVPKPKGNVLGAIDEAEALALGGSANMNAVPEPSSLALLCMGVVGLLTYIRRRR